MGQCAGGCAGSAGRTPSALQLCEAVEQQMQGSRARTRAQHNDPSSSSSQVPLHLEGESIWHYLEKREVKALGLIVERWSKGKLDGSTARQQFQSQVLRGQSQQAVELQNASSAFLRAGLDGALAGISMGSMVEPDGHRAAGGSGPHGQSGGRTAETAELHRLDDRTAGTLTAPPPPSSTASPERNGMPLVAFGLPGGLHSGGPTSAGQGVFGALADGLFSGFAAAVLGGARAGARTQNVFTAIDRIFLYCTFEDSFDMAMQELGLDGPRALPGEVGLNFQQKAQGILEAAPRQQGANASWLDLVMLCLSAEVIRHLKSGGHAEAISGGLFRAAQTRSAGGGSTGMSSSSSSPGGPQQQTIVFATASPDHPGRIDLLFGWPQLDGTRGQSAGEATPASFRMDPDFLRDRVFVLLESLLGGGLVQEGRQGLSVEEMDAHCPVRTRELCNDDACAICLEPYTAGEAVRCLPCKHELHQECCEAWLATADTCPTCRFQIPRT